MRVLFSPFDKKLKKFLETFHFGDFFAESQFAFSAALMKFSK